MPAQAVAAGASHGQIHVFRAKLTASQIKAYSQHPDQRVILLMRNQYRRGLSGGAHALTARTRHVQSSQRSVVSELRSLHAPRVHAYRFINAVSATVSRSEANRLRTNPAVAAVVPDRRVTLPSAGEATRRSGAATSDRVNATPGICGTRRHPLLQPEALKLMHAATFHHGATGKGVRIAVFPDGLDPDIPDFIRPNGKSAIFDYRDFSGDGPKGVTEGAEAFGDASSLISQGRRTYDLSHFVNPALPLRAHCDIRIRGVAPGARVAVMKIFSTEASFDSTVLQGLDWAVSHDHVNVLSESFGANPIPDAGDDPVSVFDSEAVAHGITVVTDTGDAGITNTEGSPGSTVKGAIAVAASTSYQTNAQMSEHGYQLFHDSGWLSNNVSALSSSGFTQYGPNAPDVIAPGDSGWADCSKDIKTFTFCAPLAGGTKPVPPILLFGGTSQSTPLTAGVAALVIQAYRATHHRTPTPAVVKRIITSTATNLGVPAQDQGAGLVDAARAVQLARSYKVRHHKFRPVGHTLSISRAKIEKTAAPGSAQSARIRVVNEGARKRRVHPVVQSFGRTRTILNRTVNYDPTTDPTFTYWLSGLPQPYAQQSFTVPAGYQRLNARMAYPADPNDFNQTPFEVLFDPKGRLAADSDPQGAPDGFGQVQVRNPLPGTWHAIYFFRPASDQYTGPILTSVTVQKLVRGPGSVTPSSATLPRGASRVFTVHYKMPPSGDYARAVSFGPGAGEVPILTRSLVTPTAATPGTFSAVLVGGNGRMFFNNQEQTFVFGVPAGLRDLDVDVRVADPGYELQGVLVDPRGSPVDVQDTSFVDLTRVDGTGNNPVQNNQTLHLSWRSPQAGRWHLVLGTVLGNLSGKITTPVTGKVSFNTVHVSSALVPDSPSTKLTAGQTSLATITVTNTGNAPEIYYVDPRRNGSSDYSLGWLTPTSGTMPITPTETSANVPLVLVPPATSQLGVVANSSKRINFTTAPNVGDPEVASTTGKTAVANYAAPDVPASVWACPPTLAGPFSKAETAPFACSAFGVTRTINDDVAATGGNLWDTATDVNSPNVFDPSSSTVVPPGGSTVLTVAITPSADEAGSTVSGYLSVQTLNTLDWGSDDLIHIPYTYSVMASG
jgi:hypothetical protein